MRVVFDTNVFIAALKSSRGASAVIVGMIETQRFQVLLSVPLAAEYEEQFALHAGVLGESAERVAKVLRYVLDQAVHTEIFFTWRPLLVDPDDEMLVDLAITGSADYIVTHNIKDLSNAQSLGVKLVTPAQFLAILRNQDDA